MLELRNVSKHFGGVVATDDVTLEVARGEVHALIGPNGAGKTTLIAQISGQLPVDSGRILFEGEEITRLRAYARVRAGLVRSYQVTSIFRRFSVLENLRLAIQARSGSSFSFWRPAAADTSLDDEARIIADQVGLSGKIDLIAGNLAHGDQRAPQRDAAHERLRAVDRIDDPPAPRLLPNGAELFAEDAVVRETRADPVARAVLGAAVGDGDRRAVGLPLDRERRLEMTECDRARGAGHVGHGFEEQ